MRKLPDLYELVAEEARTEKKREQARGVPSYLRQFSGEIAERKRPPQQTHKDPTAWEAGGKVDRERKRRRRHRRKRIA